MNRQRKLIVATLMPPQGETGVQTHFNAILKAAAQRGIESQLAHPYADQLLIGRKAAAIVARLIKLINPEWFVVWNRWSHYFLLKQRLKDLLKNDNDAVIYAQDPLSCRAALAVRTARQRVVCVAHFNISEAYEVQTKGLGLETGPLCRHLQTNEAQTLPKADKLIFVSAYMQALVNDRLPTIKAVPQAVIANFIEDKRQADSVANLQAELITIGTLEPRKNQAYLLRLLASAHGRGHRYRLTVIGNGPDREQLAKLAAELGIADSVNFLGFQANAAEYMAGHKVYIQTSLMESFGITLIEALCYALPILAPAVGGIPEVFDDGQQGFYLPLDDLPAATATLCQLLENPVLHNQLARQARARFETHFSEQALADVWLAAIVDA